MSIENTSLNTKNIHTTIDNAYADTNNQQAAIKMRVNSVGAITNPYYFNEHDSETYNGNPIKPGNIEEVNFMFDTVTTAQLSDQVNQNYVRYAENNIDSEYNAAYRNIRLKRTDVEKAKIRVMQAKNDYLVYKYYTLIVIVSFLFVAIIGGIFLAKSAYEVKPEYNMYIYIAMAAVGTLYILIFYLYYRETWRRRKDEWDKLIFKPPSELSSS